MFSPHTFPSPELAPLLKRASGIERMAPIDLEFSGGNPQGMSLESAAHEAALPPAERSVVSVNFDGPFWAKVTKPGFGWRSVDLQELARDSLSNPVPALRASAELFYSVLKARLGFTPEEIRLGITQHGVRFRPCEIDPTIIPVFRSRAELDGCWNNGHPADLFFEVGDAIDPQDHITSEVFYAAQAALLAARL